MKLITNLIELRKQKKAFEKNIYADCKVPNTSLEIKKEAEELYETYGETEKLFDKYKFKCIVPLVSEDFDYYRKIDIDKMVVISLSPPRVMKMNGESLKV